MIAVVAISKKALESDITEVHNEEELNNGSSATVRLCLAEEGKVTIETQGTTTKGEHEEPIELYEIRGTEFDMWEVLEVIRQDLINCKDFFPIRQISPLEVTGRRGLVVIADFNPIEEYGELERIFDGCILTQNVPQTIEKVGEIFSGIASKFWKDYWKMLSLQNFTRGTTHTIQSYTQGLYFLSGRLRRETKTIKL